MNFTDILFPTKVNLENDGDLFSACSNPTSVVLVIVLSTIIRCLILRAPKLNDAYIRRSTPGQKGSVRFDISGIRTPAKEMTITFKIQFGWKFDI